MKQTRRIELNKYRTEIITNQMMFGLKTDHHWRSHLKTKEFKQFQERHMDTIVWVDAHLPRQVSVGLLGAVAKSVLWYGKEKIEPFCLALKNGDFKGPGDPVLILYLWMNKKARDWREVYKRTITAIKNFLAGKALIRMRDGLEYKAHIRPCKQDIFEWDDTFTKMSEPKKTSSTKKEKLVFKKKKLT